MHSASSPDQLSDKKNRPRPFGLGRLSLWRVMQEIPLAQRSDTALAGFGTLPLSEGLDPIITLAPPSVWSMVFGSLAHFRIDFDDRTVRLVAAHGDADQETIDHLVDDHIAPRIIAADGQLVLHGSACVIDSQMAVFLGQTGSGKSTLAASLHAAGHRLLGDDAVVIDEADGIVLGEPVYPSLRLYRESIEQVFSEAVPTSAMAFYSDKLHVAAAQLGVGTMGPVPLGAIYILTEGEEGVTLQRILPADACMALVENSFALDPQDAATAAQRMARAARVASAVPVYELAYPYDFGLLPEARAQVIASLARPDHLV